MLKSHTNEELEKMFELFVKQSLAGGIEWIGLQQNVIAQNTLQNKRARELYEIFKVGGYRSCVLKGQETATYYVGLNYARVKNIELWVEIGMIS